MLQDAVDVLADFAEGGIDAELGVGLASRGVAVIDDHHAAGEFAFGFDIDEVIFQSWMPHPSRMVPEDADGTLTSIVRRSLNLSP